MRRVRGGADPAAEARFLLRRLAPDEKLWPLDGGDGFWSGLRGMGEHCNLRPTVMGAVPRFGIPGPRFGDGARGVAVGASTAFPVPVARGATWDLDLGDEYRLLCCPIVRGTGEKLFSAGFPLSGLAPPSGGQVPRHHWR